MSTEKDAVVTDWHRNASTSRGATSVLSKYVDIPARALMALIFLISGVGKLSAVVGTQGYMEAHGVPGILIWPAAALEIGGGILLIVGLWVQPLSLVLAGWCLLTAAIFHTAFADPTQVVMFLKNLTMAGGFLLLAKSGAPGFGLDGLFAARKRMQL